MGYCKAKSRKCKIKFTLLHIYSISGGNFKDNESETISIENAVELALMPSTSIEKKLELYENFFPDYAEDFMFQNLQTGGLMENVSDALDMFSLSDSYANNERYIEAFGILNWVFPSFLCPSLRTENVLRPVFPSKQKEIEKIIERSSQSTQIVLVPAMLMELNFDYLLLI
jgi:hypothetical protein